MVGGPNRPQGEVEGAFQPLIKITTSTANHNKTKLKQGQEYIAICSITNFISLIHKTEDLCPHNIRIIKIFSLFTHLVWEAEGAVTQAVE